MSTLFNVITVVCFITAAQHCAVSNAVIFLPSPPILTNVLNLVTNATQDFQELVTILFEEFCQGKHDFCREFRTLQVELNGQRPVGASIGLIDLHAFITSIDVNNITCDLANVVCLPNYQQYYDNCTC